MDETNPMAEALAIARGRIVKVGTLAEVLALREEGTNLIDLGGHMLMPGLIDFHVHSSQA